jgi:ATP-dependent DNA ligase
MAGPTSRWLKTKCFEESALILLGTEVKRSGPPAAHLARLEAGKLAYAGKAMIALSADDRKRLADRMQMFACAGPACPELRREPDARWVQPAIVVGVKHLKGTGGLRHATLRTIHER